jgi:hypothetical protein
MEVNQSSTNLFNNRASSLDNSPDFPTQRQSIPATLKWNLNQSKSIWNFYKPLTNLEYLIVQPIFAEIKKNNFIHNLDINKN